MNRRSFVAAATALAITCRVANAQQKATPETAATPDSSFAFDAAGTRMEKLAVTLPPLFLRGENNVVGWMDLQRQRAAFQGTSTEPDIQMLIPVSIPDDMLARAAEWKSLFGFDLDDVQETLVAGLAPQIVRVFRVDVDSSLIEAALQASGYELRDPNADMPYWTIGEDGEIELAHPVQSIFMSAANNIALLGDGMVAFAPSAQLLRQIIVRAADQGANLTPELADLLSQFPHDAANAFTVSSEWMVFDARDAADQLSRSDDAVGEMPEIVSFACGVTAGAHVRLEDQLPEARAWAVLRTSGDSEQAAAVVTWRAENLHSSVGIPYREFVGDISIEVLGDDAILVTAAGEAAARNIFMNMLPRRDMGLFARSAMR